jgi:hypothetical protein
VLRRIRTPIFEFGFGGESRLRQKALRLGRLALGRTWAFGLGCRPLFRRHAVKQAIAVTLDRFADTF